MPNSIEAEKRIDPRLELTLSMALRESPTANDFIQTIHGRIFVQYDQDDSEQIAGSIDASLLQFGDAMEHGVSADQLGDSVSGDIAEYWELLFDLETGRWNDKLRNEFEIYRTDLLIIDCIELQPRLRGHGLGMLAIERIIEVFGGGCGVVACKPWPLQFTPAFAANPEKLEQLRPPVSALETSLRKLRTYWSKAGFWPVGNSGLYVMSTSQRIRLTACKNKKTMRKLLVRTLPCHRPEAPSLLNARGNLPPITSQPAFQVVLALSWPNTPRASTWSIPSRSEWIGSSGTLSRCSARSSLGARRIALYFRKTQVVCRLRLESGLRLGVAVNTFNNLAA